MYAMRQDIHYIYNLHPADFATVIFTREVIIRGIDGQRPRTLKHVLQVFRVAALIRQR